MLVEEDSSSLGREAIGLVGVEKRGSDKGGLISRPKRRGKGQKAGLPSRKNLIFQHNGTVPNLVEIII